MLLSFTQICDFLFVESRSMPGSVLGNLQITSLNPYDNIIMRHIINEDSSINKVIWSMYTND